MKAIYLSSILLFALFSVSRAQNYAYQQIAWDAEPSWKEIDSSLSGETEVILYDHRIIEHFYSELHNNRLLQYYTIHRKIRVLQEGAIEHRNKVYIPLGNALELTEAKARVIKPTGEIIEFDQSNILETSGDDESEKLNYFAIDGIVKGADIEFSYTKLELPNMKGSRVRLQEETAIEKSVFEFHAPSNLEYAFKSYNGYPEIEKDTSVNEKNVYRVQAQHIPVLKNEPYSAPERSEQFIIYKLYGNSASGRMNIFKFGNIAQDIYENYFGEETKANLKVLNKFLATSGVKHIDDREKKIRFLEQYIKKNIGILPQLNTSSIDLKESITHGITSKYGIIHVFAQSLKQLNIPCELVITGDRFEDIFDEIYNLMRESDPNRFKKLS